MSWPSQWCEFKKETQAKFDHTSAILDESSYTSYQMVHHSPPLPSSPRGHDQRLWEEEVTNPNNFLNGRFAAHTLGRPPLCLKMEDGSSDVLTAWWDVLPAINGRWWLALDVRLSNRCQPEPTITMNSGGWIDQEIIAFLQSAHHLELLSIRPLYHAAKRLI